MRSEIGEFLFHYSRCFPAVGLMFPWHAVEEPSMSHSSAVMHTRLDREAPSFRKTLYPKVPGCHWSWPGFWVALHSRGHWYLLELLSSTTTGFVFILRSLFTLFSKVRHKAQWVSWFLRALRKSSLESFWAFWKSICLWYRSLHFPGHPTEPKKPCIHFQLSYPVSSRCVLFKHGNKIGEGNKGIS